MPSSEARIAANRRNALKSTGPKTEEGKEQSRRNALKHGLTGAGVVLPEADAAAVDRKAAAYARELDATGELGHDLARRAALNAVRMDRSADQQTAALAERVRQVEVDFVAPEGVGEAEATRLRSEAVRRAMFDPSKEATLARRYECAAERAFFRCLKELRQMQRQTRAEVRVDTTLEAQALMGSFLQAQQAEREMDERMNVLAAEVGLPPLDLSAIPSYLPPFGAGFDLPITVGKRR
jgi:hypothetical protein